MAISVHNFSTHSSVANEPEVDILVAGDWMNSVTLCLARH